MSEYPRWRRDLPLDQGRDEYVTRREFTKFVVLISGATFLGNGYLVVQNMLEQTQKPGPLDIVGVDEVPVGGSRLFRYPTAQDPAILIRLSDSEWVAYAQRCTHLSCPVVYSAAERRLNCPCHDGAFDAASGRVLKGPPPRPLPRIEIKVEAGRVIAQGLTHHA